MSRIYKSAMRAWVTWKERGSGISMQVQRSTCMLSKTWGWGFDDRVWLTCTRSGAVCVFKFPIKSQKQELRDDVRREIENWKVAYP
eukprot:scaffold42123_cov221-Amphora_coffeaeformis.AAC.1